MAAAVTDGAGPSGQSVSGEAVGVAQQRFARSARRDGTAAPPAASVSNAARGASGYGRGGMVSRLGIGLAASRVAGVCSGAAAASSGAASGVA